AGREGEGGGLGAGGAGGAGAPSGHVAEVAGLELGAVAGAAQEDALRADLAVGMDREALALLALELLLFHELGEEPVESLVEGREGLAVLELILEHRERHEITAKIDGRAGGAFKLHPPGIIKRNPIVKVHEVL